MTRRGVTLARYLLATALLAAQSLAAAPAPANGASHLLETGDWHLVIDEERIEVRTAERAVIRIDSIEFNFTPALGWTVAAADAGSVTLRGRFPAGVDFDKAADDTEPRVAELRISVRDSGFRLQAAPDWATHVTLNFDYLGDHFFGLTESLQPDNRLSPDLTGKRVRLEVESEGDAWHENYASAMAAFYMSSYGYGAFFDTFARGVYSFGINGRNRIHHDTGELDWYVFPGADGREIHAGFYDVVGAPRNVPAWALGPVGWRDQNDGGAPEILADIDRMTALEIPFTAWFVDRPYSDGTHAWSTMNFNADFANPGDWIGTIRDDYGLEFMTWVSPATFGDARFDQHLAGAHTYIDLSHPPTVAAYQDALRKQQYVYGVRGHKIDRADERFPVYEDWHDTAVPVAERRNRYPYLLAQIQDEALRSVWGDDQFTFARAAIHRTQPYLSAIWGGDARSTWEGLRGNFANAARSAFAGFAVWGTDAGGYLGDGRIPRDLFIRWLQAASMAGLFEIKLDGAGGAGEDRMPWRYDDDFQAIFRAICADRMRLVPYLYSLARTSATTGTLMQPLAYRHLDDPEAWPVWDQFYVGDAVLVAPVFEPGTNRRVYLPPGRWHAFGNPAVAFDGGRSIEIEVPLDTLPRFVRDNSVFVTGNIYRGNDRNWSDEDAVLVIHAFPGGAGSSAHFDYVDMRDDDVTKTISMQSDDAGVRLAGPALSTPAVLELRLDSKPAALQLNDAPAAVDYTASEKVLRVPIGADKPFAIRIAR